MTDFATLTDKQLAEALLAAELSGDTDEMLGAENEILYRVESPHDDSHGLSPESWEMIKDFCRDKGIAVTPA